LRRLWPRLLHIVLDVFFDSMLSGFAVAWLDSND
jgi:hypothetical protein